MVHCSVLNSKFTHQGLSNNCLKLLKVKPVQIKPKLFRVIVNSFAWQVSLLNWTLVIFFYQITEEKKRFQNQRNTYCTCCNVQGNKYDVSKPHRYSYCKFVASEHRKNLFPSPGLKKSEQKARQSDSRKPILVAIDSQGRLSDK